MNTLLPPGWPRPRGYANGVVASGRTIFVAGMIGWDAQGVFHSDDFAHTIDMTENEMPAELIAELQALLKIDAASFSPVAKHCNRKSLRHGLNGEPGPALALPHVNDRQAHA